MLRRTLGIGIIVACGLAALPAASWGQSAGGGNFAGVSDGTDSANSGSLFARLPSTDDGGDVQTASAEYPASSTAANARIAALEAKIAELDTMLKDPPKNEGYLVGSDTALLGKWTPQGPTFRSKNGDFIWKMRIVAQLDAINEQSPQGTGPGGVGRPGAGNGVGAQDSTTFRRLRIGAEGTMYETIDWVWEVDLAMALQNFDPGVGATPVTGLRSIGTAGGVAGAAAVNQAGNTGNVIQPTTVFMTFTQLPVVGNIRVGNQQDWLSLEHIESARFLDFMERSPIMDCFTGPNNNGYTPGISAFNMSANKRLAWELGVYKNQYYDSGFPYSIGTNALSYGGRVTCTPYYDEPSDGRYLLHLGAGGEYRTMNTELPANQNGDNVRLRDRGEARNASSTLDPNFADTGNFYAKSQGVLVPEMAFQWGPALIQAEWCALYFNNAQTTQNAMYAGAAIPANYIAHTGQSLGNVFYQGGYIQALYFLTGENRQYNRQSGVFNRVVPFENWSLTRGAGCCGWGAWQVGLRFDWLDLNSGYVRGGNVQDVTVGLNWFLNPNARFQVNYVCAYYNNNGGTSPLVTTTNTAAGLANNNVGFLQGSLFTGDAVVNILAARMDFNW